MAAGDVTAADLPAAVRPTFIRLWAAVAALGITGVAAMALAPIELLAPNTGLPPAVLRLATLIQPAILVVALAALGAAAAPPVSLRAPAVEALLGGGLAGLALRRQLPAALAAALLTAAILTGFEAVTATLRERASAGGMGDFAVPLATRLLYGGIAEEVMMRWGVMSLLVWAGWRLAQRPVAVPGWCYWAGIAGAAALFAVGHLPILFMLMPGPPAWLVALVLAGNFVPGAIFGWLFWRRGLEAAMLAHAGAHLLAWSAAAAA